MPIQLTCPGCSKQFRVADEHSGKKAKCPTCSTIFEVPQTATGPHNAVAAGEQTPHISRPAPRESTYGAETGHESFASVDQASPYQPSQYAAQAFQPPPPPSSEQTMGQISIGLGVVSLIGEFIVPFFFFCCCGALAAFIPAAMVVPSGIGLALAFQASENTKMAGIIINSIALAVSVLAIIGLIVLFALYGVMIFQAQQQNQGGF